MLKKLLNSLTINRIIKYCSVGALNTLVTTGVMYALSLLGCHYLLYTAGGYLTAFLISFFLNLHFTFSVSGNLKKRLLAFVLINLVNLLQVEIIEIVLIEYAKQPHLLAIFVGMIWYVIFGFLMNQKYVFQAATNPA